MKRIKESVVMTKLFEMVQYAKPDVFAYLCSEMFGRQFIPLHPRSGWEAGANQMYSSFEQPCMRRGDLQEKIVEKCQSIGPEELDRFIEAAFNVKVHGHSVHPIGDDGNYFLVSPGLGYDHRSELGSLTPDSDDIDMADLKNLVLHLARFRAAGADHVSLSALVTDDETTLGSLVERACGFFDIREQQLREEDQAGVEPR